MNKPKLLGETGSCLFVAGVIAALLIAIAVGLYYFGKI
jgi:hypothetical protein